jgi:hypothetical protein
LNVVDWLFGSDPAIRWQVLGDLTDGSPHEVAAERARVEREGWGARLLALEGADGLWDGGALFPASYTGGEPGQPWTTTVHTLQTSQIFGLDPASEAARRAIALIAEHGRWEHAGERYFDGEVEPCINGRTIETGAYFAVDVAPIVERILGERLTDGGWNCEVENGSVRSSFDTTINVLDGLLGFERATGGSAAVREARRSGEEYLLERGLFGRKSTGEIANPEYLDFAFPYYWRYECSERSTTSGVRASSRIPGWRRPWTSCARSGSRTAAGCSTASIPGASTSSSSVAWGSQAAGTPSERSACSTGGKAAGRARRTSTWPASSTASLIAVAVSGVVVDRTRIAAGCPP